MAFRNTVFGQLLAYLKQLDFDSVVSNHHDGAKPRKFDYWSQLVSMVFCQFAGTSSIRDLIINFNAKRKMHYHWDVKTLKRSTLADANQDRNYKVFEILFYKALGLYHRGLKKKVKELTYIIDSTTIDLCLSLFPWAAFRKHKGAVKIHTLLNATESIPEYIVVTDGKKHDLHPGKQLVKRLPKGSIIMMDRAYIDFDWLYQLQQQSKFFVTRAKGNMNFTIRQNLKHNCSPGILADQIISPGNDKYPETMRLVTFSDGKVTYRFLTNILSLDASAIADLYQQRWAVELFFKWIKQHLKIKKFIGCSKNAVLIQIYTALLVYILTAYLKKISGSDFSLLKAYRIIKANLFERLSVFDVLNPKPDPPDMHENLNQPTLLNFCTGQ